MMKTLKTPLRLGLSVVTMLCLAPAALADNPIVQTIYTADPAPMVHGDTLYLYTGHDEDKSSYFTMKDWHCFSTKDMVNWTDLGTPLSLKEFKWAKSDAWAGQCIERHGQFYYYVPIGRKEGGMAIGVAVSKSPVGPFTDALGKPLVFDNWGDIDPCLFIDDDDQAYLYWGNPTLKSVLLNKDMISYDATYGDHGIFRDPMTVESFGKRSKNDRATSYEEGPWLYKRKGLYYMIYAAGPISEHLAYATGKTAKGPWKYGGVIMSPQGASFTNHPGVVDYKGHTYIFYHNGALPGGGGFTRSVCVEEMKFNADGSIQQLNMTKEGSAPVGKLNPYVRNEAETIAWETGIKTERCENGGMDVIGMQPESYIRVDNVDFGASGARRFTACVSGAPEIELRLDALDGPVIGNVTAPTTKAEHPWVQASSSVHGARGVHRLFFVFKGNFRFDYWRFGA